MAFSIHKREAPRTVKTAIVSVSTTRKAEDDKSGSWIRNACKKEGHNIVFYQIVPDEKTDIKDTLERALTEHQARVVILTGGTGLSPLDVTIEAVSPLFEKVLTAFGAIFAQISYEQIDSAAILSRATAGTIGKAVVFCIPGSLEACKLACKALILPEMGHIIKHLNET
jgi:molybdenum cofactor biosynthesis protein B